MSTLTGTILLPGDALPYPTSKIGPGLHFSTPSPSSSSSSSTRPDRPVHAVRAGPLLSSSSGASSTSYLGRPSAHYSPAQNDTVIGQIVGRSAESYRVDLGAALSGTLDHLAFHNVNRKSRPNLGPGALVYARISSHLAAMEPELRCDAPDGRSSGGFGVLDSDSSTGTGYLHGLSTRLCARLQSPRDVTLQLIGDKVEYEIVVGMNGRIWVKADEKKVVILVVQILRQVEFLSEGETRDLIAKRLKEL